MQDFHCCVEENYEKGPVVVNLLEKARFFTLFEDFNDVALRSHERHILDIMCVGVPGMTVARIRDYMYRVDDVQCCSSSESMQPWADYLRMLRDLEADLTDTKLVFPNFLKREHDTCFFQIHKPVPNPS